MVVWVRRLNSLDPGTTLNHVIEFNLKNCTEQGMNASSCHQNCTGGHETRSTFVLGKELSSLCDPTLLTSCHVILILLYIMLYLDLHQSIDDTGTQAISPKSKGCN